MNPNRRAVTLQDVVMGKKGIRYTLTEMVTILTHYNITPVLQQTRVKRLALFQQLHKLDNYEGGLTRYDRRRILSGQMPPVQGSPGAESMEPDALEESEIEEVAELPTPFIKPKLSMLSPYHECSVCLEIYSWHRFPRRRITAGCNHEPTICCDCLEGAIDSQIRSRAWDTLTCPLCPMKLSFEAVKEYSSQECFEKYDRHATMHALRGVPNFCMCLGPGCDSGQVHASGNRQPIMTCNVCQFKTCFTHQMPWHGGMTCTEYDQIRGCQNEENESSLALLRNIGLICPSCSLPGIKVSGCDHMTCPRCSYQYCSRCLASYKTIQQEGNTAHKPTCPYHSSRLPSDAMTDPEGFLDENGNLLPWQDEVENEDGDEIEEEDEDGDEDEVDVAPVDQRHRLPRLLPQGRRHANPASRRQFPNHGHDADPPRLDRFGTRNALEQFNDAYYPISELFLRRA